MSDESHVVTAFLRHGGDVLLGRRSDAVGTYAGRWAGVSGHAEDDPDDQVRVEIAEETGLGDAVSFVRSARPVEVADGDRTWIVHPYLFECDSRAVEPDEEHDAVEWVPPTAILGRETVPALWTTYERVAPSVRTIAADDEHGAAWLSIRALEVLRDRAGVILDERGRTNDPDAGDGDGERRAADDADGEWADADGEWAELSALARRLLEARPAMAPLRNRVNRAMATADERSAAGVLASAIDGIERALEADERAAERASEYADGAVLTLSRSGTVLAALRRGSPSRVFVAESRPAREGVTLAEELAPEVPVTVHTDAATAHLLASGDVDRVLVGADAVFPDGRVVNKTGTRAIALAAARADVPVYVAAASDKVSTREEPAFESGPRSAVYDGPAPVDVRNPTFDATPPDLVEAVVTERGPLATDEVADVAARLRERAAWRAE